MHNTRLWVKQIRDRLMSTQDTLCLERARLVTEAYQAYDGDPVPMKRAKAFAHVLQHMTLDLDTNPILAGNTSSRPRGWMLVPEHGFAPAPQVLLENEGLDTLLDQIPQDLLDYWQGRSLGGNSGIGHLAVDLWRVVHDGLEAIVAEAQRCDDGTDSAENVYRRAMVIALRAVIAWAHRYADAADAAAQTEPDPLIRAAHQRVARACQRVPARPARSLFEALQAIVLVHLAIAIEGHGMSVSIGLPDRVLAPFVDDDLDLGDATSLIAAFMLKITANSIFGRGSKTQAITVGGADHFGRDRCNVLTRCFLDACDFVRVGDPHVFLRWHKGLDPEIGTHAIELLAQGTSMPLLINDVPTAQGFISAGIAPEDAWEYCVIGCNELGVPGRLAESATARAGMVQYLGLLNQTLIEHPEPDTIQDMGQLLVCLEQTMSQQMAKAREQSIQGRGRTVDRAPTPFTSALMRGCVARGQDMLVGMAYHLPGLYERGLTNAINALAAIEQVVFEEKALSMSELIAEMRANFDQKPGSAHNRLLAAPKWGNDDDRADLWASELVDMRERVLNAVDRTHGQAAHMVCHVVRSLHYLDGKRIAASPDGRLAGTPLADSIGAQLGTAYAGPTAMLNSVLKLDAAQTYRGGYNLNLTLPGRTAPGVIAALVETFFGKGGQELQINCLDAATLRAAQAHPERHGELVVRVAGFSARFVDLARVEQEELIARAEAL